MLAWEAWKGELVVEEDGEEVGEDRVKGEMSRGKVEERRLSRGGNVWEGG